MTTNDPLAGWQVYEPDETRPDGWERREQREAGESIVFTLLLGVLFTVVFVLAAAGYAWLSAGAR